MTEEKNNPSTGSKAPYGASKNNLLALAIFVSTVVVGVVVLIAINKIAGTKTNLESTQNIIKKNNETTEKQDQIFVFAEKEFDFGVIKQSGGKVSHDFEFIYNGEKPTTITGVPTSCACTSARVDKTQLNSGDKGKITVTFNPNLHAEPEGKFFKTALLLLEPKTQENLEVKIWVEIDLDLGEDAFELGAGHADEEGE